MSVHQPVFLGWEEFRSAGSHAGLYFHMAVRSNRAKVVRLAAELTGCDQVAAGRLAFVTWMAEFRSVSEDPFLQPLPVRHARPSGREAWWRYREGTTERTLPA